MKKITLLFAFLLATFSWQVNAQTLNQPANWPNTNWTLNVIAHTGTDPQDVEANPTVDANFAYDDDDTGYPSHDEIAAESPVIDLTAAHAAGENFLRISGDYAYNKFSTNPEYLAIEYWDADASAWNLFYQFPDVDTTGSPTDDFCNATHDPYDVVFDISAFTATQLSGFKYRFIYNDDTTGGNGNNWGFCFSSPTLQSTAYLDPTFSTSLTNIDCANSQFSVEVDVTNFGGANSVTISDDQGSATQQLLATGTATFGPYASGTNVNFTVTNDDDASVTATNAITYTCPTNNDDCYNADALTVYDLGAGTGNETTVDSANYTDSGVHSTCDNDGTNLDMWYAVTVPAGEYGFKAIYTGDKADKVESALWDSCGGNQIACFASSSNASQIFQGLTSGTTYYLQLWLDDTNTGTFDVVLEKLPPAPNCADTPTPADAATAVAFETGNKITLSWVAPATGVAVDEYKLEIGTASGSYSFTTTLTDTSIGIRGFSENSTYYWKVTPLATGVEAIGCPEWSFTTDAFPTVVNDACANATALTVDPNACVTPTVADNSFATDSGVAAPSCGSFGYSGGDLWYTVTVPASGSISVETSEVTGSNLSDTQMAIYSGACGTLTEIDCNDDIDYPSNAFSKIELTGQNPGDVLYVRVWEYGNDEFGEFNVCAWDPLSAIADNQIEGFKFFPNPVNNVLNMTAKDNIEAVSITNITGQEVMNVAPNAMETQVNMSQLQNGIYFVKVQVNGQVTAFKVIKK